MRRLVVPATLAVTVVAGAASLLGGSCSDDYNPECRLFCIPDDPPPTDGGIADAGPPVECPACSDDNGQCPLGCRAVG